MKMERKVTLQFCADEDIVCKFRAAAELRGDDIDKAAEDALRGYISRAFERLSREYAPKGHGCQELDTERQHGRQGRGKGGFEGGPECREGREGHECQEGYEDSEGHPGQEGRRGHGGRGRGEGYEHGNFGKALRKIPRWAANKGQYNHKIIKAYFMAGDIYGQATVENMEALCSDPENQELYVPTFRDNYAQMKRDGEKSHGRVFVDDGQNVSVWPVAQEVLERYKESFYSKPQQPPQPDGETPQS